MTARLFPKLGRMKIHWLTLTKKTKNTKQKQKKNEKKLFLNWLFLSMNKCNQYKKHIDFVPVSARSVKKNEIAYLFVINLSLNSGNFM